MANDDPNRGQLSLEGSEKDVIRPCPLETSKPTKIQAFVDEMLICPLETSKPTKIQAFVDEMLIEIFVNDQFVQTSIPNIWWPTEGTLKFTSEGGKAEILSNLVKVHR
jgi:sucrose-6-phosphate hydrolase SacC (GH32 family)